MSVNLLCLTHANTFGQRGHTRTHTDTHGHTGARERTHAHEHARARTTEVSSIRGERDLCDLHTGHEVIPPYE